MKIKNTPTDLASFFRLNHFGLIIASIYCTFQLCCLNGIAQNVYWLESISNNVKGINIATTPVAAIGATTLAAANVPLYIFTDNRNGFVYWSDAATGSIKRVSTGGAITDVVTGISGAGIYPRGIYVDVTKNILYWGQTSPGANDVIKKINIAGALPKSSSSGGKLVTSISIVRGITVDTATSQIYFADAGTTGTGKGIYRSSTTSVSTEAASTFITSTVTKAQPNSLFLDRANNFIYWSDFSTNGGIRRAATNVTFPVVSTNVITGFSVRGISINTSANIIYWTEYPTMKIRMGSLATIPVSPRTDVVTGLLDLPRSLQFYPCVAPGIVSITADNNALCRGSTANLTANGITGNDALVTWYSGPLGTGANLGTGTTLSNVGVGTYYARVTGTCGTPAEKFITITGDITPPSITCPVNVVEPNMGSCNKSFHIDNPIYSDNCGSIQSLTWKLTGATTSSSLATAIKLLGTRTFNNGVTYVIYTAKDSANNTSTCSFTITLNDVVIPVFTTTNTSILDSFPSACLKSIFIPDVTFTDNCGTPLLTWNKAGATNESGSGQMGQTNFNVGVTNVTDTITDANGNKKTTAFTVTLLDNLPPNLTCPPDKTPSVLPSGCSKIVTTTPPSFSDNCTIQSLTWSMSGSTILSSPLTGINLVGSKTFNAGTTVVTYTAKDPSGNSTICSFNVKLNTVDVCPTAIIARGISTSEANVIKLKARLTPNPTTSSFALQIQSDSKEQVEVSVYNNEGKKVQYLKVTPQQVICIGEKYVNGMYLFEVRQGDKRTTVIGVKQ